MCELFGVSSPEKIILNRFLEEFFSDGNEHPHGWGMAFFGAQKLFMEKRPECSVQSNYLKRRLKERIAAREMIAHIRLATRGMVSSDNTHPFLMEDASGRNWTLAHNGTIFESRELVPFITVQRGKTDSERILWYIIKQINHAQRVRGGTLCPTERFALLDRIVCELAPENKLNLLISDGDYLYVHTNYKDSLYRGRLQKGLILSTRPLRTGNISWEPVPMNQLLVYKEGDLCYTGTKHSYEFILTEEKERLLFPDEAGFM